MNEQQLIGYDPKCALFSRTRKSGNTQYYIKYYLPNGERMRRPISPDAKEAKKLFGIKRLQLLKGIFDDKDYEKMPLERFAVKKSERLTIETAVPLYLETRQSRVLN